MNSRPLKPILVLLGILASGLLHGDTVHLLNGSSIDGTVIAQHGGEVVIQIGKIGRLKVPEDQVMTIERNSRRGHQGDSGATRRKPPEVVKTPEKKPETAPAEKSVGTPVEVQLAPEQEAQVKEWVRDLARQRVTYRTRAERRLSTVGEGVVPFLVPLVTHPFDLTQISALRLLKKFPDARIAPAALAVLADSNRFVRKLAWENLQGISGLKLPYPWDDTSSDRQRLRAARGWNQWWQGEKKRLEAIKLAAQASAPISAKSSPSGD